MESIILLMVALVVGLSTLFCLFYVLVKMYREKGILHALLGFFCCTLYPFIWGWLNAKRLKMYDIMIFWTVTSIFGAIIQVVVEFFNVNERLDLFLGQ